MVYNVEASSESAKSKVLPDNPEEALFIRTVGNLVPAAMVTARFVGVDSSVPIHPSDTTTVQHVGVLKANARTLNSHARAEAQALFPEIRATYGERALDLDEMRDIAKNNMGSLDDVKRVRNFLTWNGLDQKTAKVLQNSTWKDDLYFVEGRGLTQSESGLMAKSRMSTVADAYSAAARQIDQVYAERKPVVAAQHASRWKGDLGTLVASGAIIYGFDKAMFNDVTHSVRTLGTDFVVQTGAMLMRANPFAKVAAMTSVHAGLRYWDKLDAEKQIKKPE